MKLFFLIYCSFYFLYGIPNKTIFHNTTNQNQDGFAIVELFTSEGCSSCPPADEAVIELSRAFKKNLFILGFHVDYWDHLGWKDAFSQSQFSRRQQWYAKFFHLDNIYTPQVVINGRDQFIGSDKIKLHQAVETELRRAKGSMLGLTVVHHDTKLIGINYNINQDSSRLLNIALVELVGKTEVKRGENRGKLLNHINIVREFKTIQNPGDKGIVELKIPKDLNAQDIRIIAFTQDKADWHITAASDCSIPLN